MRVIALLLIGFLLGVIAGVLALQIDSAASYHRGLSEPSSAAVARPMRELSIDPGTIRSGNPIVHGNTYARTTGGSTQAGFWSCVGPAVIDFEFPADEWLFVLEGSVDVEYLGHHFRLQPGDAALFRAGTMSTWNVPETVKKVWVQHEPSSAARRFSWLF